MFGEKIRYLREKKGLTQQELANAIGISKSAIANYECGLRKPKKDNTWIKIANFFGVTVDYLMGIEKDTSPDSPHVIAADTITTDGEPIVIHSHKTENPIDEVDFALYGEIKDLTPAEKSDIISYIQFKKSQRNNK